MSEHAAQMANIRCINKNFDAVRRVVNEHANRLTFLGCAYLVVYVLTILNDHDIKKNRNEIRALKKRVFDMEDWEFAAEMEK